MLSQDLPNNAEKFDKKNSYKIFDQIASQYDFLNHFLSLGIDFYWRKKLVEPISRQDKKLTILDLATGTGDLAILMGRFPHVEKVIGLDLSREMIQKGKEKISKHQLTSKIDLQQGDAVDIPMPDSTFDAVTISFGIRNFSHPQRSLENIHRVLKKGGKVLILEFSLPSWDIGKRLYLIYLRYILPKIGNLLSGHSHAYTYLNETIESFPYGSNFLEWMKEARFSSLQKIPLTFGIATLYVGIKE